MRIMIIAAEMGLMDNGVCTVSIVGPAPCGLYFIGLYRARSDRDVFAYAKRRRQLSLQRLGVATGIASSRIVDPVERGRG